MKSQRCSARRELKSGEEMERAIAQVPVQNENGEISEENMDRLQAVPPFLLIFSFVTVRFCSHTLDKSEITRNI
jgi:hypothetical protein